VRSLAGGERSSLLPRIASALVLAPVAIAAIWFGGLPFQLLTLGAAGIMAWEWARLCRGGTLGRSGLTGIAVVLVVVVLGASGLTMPAVVLSLTGSLAIYALGRIDGDTAPSWLAAGLIWLALPCVLLLWLSRLDPAGRTTVLWIFAIVWATDVGAYAAGRGIGGPRLAPRLSPRKTWAGLIGGVFCAGLAGWSTGHFTAVSPVLPLILVSAALAIVEQFGDLVESMAKRRFNVKDSSGLIPGHGGLLDRLDGLLTVVPAVALLTWIDNGRVLAWR